MTGAAMTASSASAAPTRAAAREPKLRRRIAMLPIVTSNLHSTLHMRPVRTPKGRMAPWSTQFPRKFAAPSVNRGLTRVLELLQMRFPSQRLHRDGLKALERGTPAEAHADLVGGGNDGRWIAGTARRQAYFEVGAGRALHRVDHLQHREAF